MPTSRRQELAVACAPGGTQAAPFDLHAYLRRISLPAPPSPGLAGVMAAHLAHRRAIPFENLDMWLDRPISLDPADVFAKLVTARRGGYCFEQNALFLSALHALGLNARPLLARVWLAATDTPPLTHTLNLVEIDGVDWIADVGFGDGFTPCLPLADGAEAVSGWGVRHRLVRDPRGWLLQRDGGPAEGGKGWLDQYSFSTDAVFPADLAMANHWTSTHPTARHVRIRIVGRVTPDGRIGLIDRHFTDIRAGGRTETDITDAPSYRVLLADRFDLCLSETEVAELGLF